MESMIYRIDDPEFSAYARVGIAGMALAFEAAEERGEYDQLEPLEYEVSEEGLTISWPGDLRPQEVLPNLVEYAWQARQVTEDTYEGELGVFFFPGTQNGLEDNLDRRLAVHSGIIATVLQSPQTQPRTKEERFFEVDVNGKGVSVSYKTIKEKISHINKLCGDGANELFSYGKLREEAKGSGSYLYPGSELPDGHASWVGSAKQAFALFFSPTACYYMKVGKTDWAIVIPHFRNLREYMDERRAQNFSYSSIQANSAEDAGMRVLSRGKTWFEEEASSGVRSNYQCRCEVAQFGKVGFFSRHQSTRRGFARIDPSDSKLAAYQRLEFRLPNEVYSNEDDEYQISAISPRGVIARNLLDKNYWYKDLLKVPRELKDFASKKGSPRKWWVERVIGPRAEELNKFMEDMKEIKGDEYSDDDVFREFFNKALHQAYGRETDKATESGRSPENRMSDYRDGLRRKLFSSKTGNMFRDTITEFFSEASLGNFPEEKKKKVWRMINDDEGWRRIRDLALFCLSTYKNSSENDGDE